MAVETWDLATLSELTENSLLDKLKEAYNKNVIYVSILLFDLIISLLI